MLEPQKFRWALIQALPITETLYRVAVPLPQYVYFSSSHIKALHPNVLIVVGMRGAGKSFWWAALQDASIRELIAQVDRLVRIEERTEVRIGYGEPLSPDQYPDKDTLKRLLKNHEPRRIWRTVVAYALFREKLPPVANWEERVAWVERHPQEIARWLDEKDRELQERNTRAIVLFDALDRAADRWEDMYALIRGVLQVALELGATRHIRAKVFLRPDQMDKTRVATFPDACKVILSSVSLDWPRPDLYGLLWQHLANTEGAENLRAAAETALGIHWEQFFLGGRTIWRWPWAFRNNEEKHRQLFRMLVGGGSGRSFYSWLPNYLADARGWVSPRTFLVAIRTAAEDTQYRYPEHKYALHHESIRRGALIASELRVRELSEDYPWIDVLMSPLRGMSIPCKFESIRGQWEQEGVLEKLQRLSEEGKLPPARLKEGYPGLYRDLEDLGVFLRMSDDWVNVPNAFWFGYGLGQRGGVKLL